MKFSKVLNETTPDGLKYSINMIFEVRKNRDMFECIYKWINAAFKDKKDTAFLKLKKLASFKANGPIEFSINKIQSAIINDFNKVGLGKYLVSSDNECWSNLQTSMAAFTKAFPEKTRSFISKTGEDFIIHIRYESDNNGKGRFMPAGNPPSGTINAQEKEQFLVTT